MKKLSGFFVFLLTFFALTQLVLADQIQYDNLCSDYTTGIGSAFRILGHVIVVIKWVAPFIIIVMGMIEFGKATLESDEKAMSKAASSLLRRFIAGLSIFFAPTIILALLNLTGLTNDMEGMNSTTKYSNCTKCLLDANKYCSIFQTPTP